MKEKNIQELAIRMGLISVEDMCQYTITQLVVKIANKVNELVGEVWRFETNVQEMLKTQNENIQYLLGEGLHLEVENIFDGWVQDGTFDTLLNQSALKKVNDRIDETNAQLSQTASVVGGVNNYDVNQYIKSHGVTTGLQMIIDDVCEKGQGLVLLNGIYEIDRPLTVERTNKNLATSIKFYGNATIRKSGNFVGDRLVTFKIGYHDEDCITFDGITFDGVDRTVNGIDNYNESLAYNENPSSINDGNQSKYVNFNQCTFINCYTGARLGSLSYVFTGCLFHSNIYGIKLNCSANANTFTGCSIRRNVIGVELRQLDNTVGTVANSFYTCTIESNRNLGVASYNDRDTKIIGCYFEANGWKIDSNFPSYNNKRCHIYYGSIGGVGRHYIDSFFNTSDVTIGGKQFSGIIANRVSCEFDLVSDNSFINTDLSAIKISANQNYESRFRLNDNKLYYSPKLSSEIICESDNYNTMLNAIDFNRTHTTTITDISDLTKVKLFSFEVNQVSQAICELLICMTGKSSGGAPSSQGFIKTNILISHKYNQTFANVDDTRFIGPVDGKSDSIKSNNIFTNDTSTLIIERETTNKFGVYVTNIKNTSITDWGKYVKIDVDISVNVTGTYRSKNANHILIS